MNLKFNIDNIGSWTPAQISTAAWYDASDTDTITESVSGVSQWSDKSGNDAHATQTVDSKQPQTGAVINDLNAISFDGVTQFFDLLANQPANDGDAMVFIVAEPNGSTARQRLFAFQETVATRWSMELENPSGFADYNQDDASFGGVDIAYDRDSGPQIFSGYRRGEFNNAGNNGTYATEVGGAITPPPGNELNEWRIGGYRNNPDSFVYLLDGAIGEFIIVKQYNFDLLQRVEGYLAKKWGIQNKLPNGHPYKNTREGFLNLSSKRLKLTTGTRAWTPADITTVAWYDASDETTITDIGGAVSQLDDKSGNDRHMVQATGTDQPATGSDSIDSKNVLTFNREQFLQTANALKADPMFPINTKVNVFYVMQVIDLDVPDTRNTFLQIKDGSPIMIVEGPYRSLGSTTSDILNAGIWMANGQTIFDSTFPENRGQIATVMNDGALTQARDLGQPQDVSANPVIGVSQFDRTVTNGAVSTWLNGGSGSTQAGTIPISQKQATNIILGANGSLNQDYAKLNGYIGEFIFTTGELTDSDRTKMEGYLAHKWGQTSNLPVGHPYKTSMPTVPIIKA